MAVNGTGLSASLANVAGAIRRAAQATGASFDYLLATAKVESNLNSNVNSSTSSATGLFQFIEQTWLATLKRAGPALGYGEYASSIVQTPGGYAVADASMRNAVLDLRRDPATNAAMAGAFTQYNSAELRGRLGRPATDGELYIAHFLGVGGAARLIVQAARGPDSPAADLFPAAAQSNRSIFYDREGRARNAGQVYGILVGRFESARTKMSDLAVEMRPRVAVGAHPASDPAGTFRALETSNAAPDAEGVESGSAFYALFHTGGRRQPISPVVGALWGGGAGPVQARDSNSAPLAVSHRREHVDLRELYQNGRSNVRSLFEGAS